MADLIAGPDFSLNPAEGYVLGGAILPHDAAMTVAAYPGGQADLEQTPEWADAVQVACRRHGQSPVSTGDPSDLPEDVRGEALSDVLRRLHAKQAENLATTAWPATEKDAPGVFLIDDTELRKHYGRLIGLIAASHWWDVGELKRGLPAILGAPRGFPSDWAVDAVKIACLLRTADAAHVTQDRAPHFSHVLQRPKDGSAAHWNFQAKIAQPQVQKHGLVYTSTVFDVDEADAWWLAFDTFCMDRP